MHRSSAEVVAFIEQHQAVAVLRPADPQQLLPVVHALYAGGLRILELTMSIPGAIDLIPDVRKAFPQGDVLIGLGSVTDPQTADLAIDARADFIVSPVLNPALIRAVKARETAMISGAFTPSEVWEARRLGSDIIKIFPADALGPKFFKSILAPMPGLKLMPTGGVSLTNGGEWLAAGACAVGLGSALVPQKALSEGDYDTLRQNAETVLHHLKKAVSA